MFLEHVLLHSEPILADIIYHFPNRNTFMETTDEQCPSFGFLNVRVLYAGQF